MLREMRELTWVIAIAACGPMYAQPQQQPAPAAPPPAVGEPDPEPAPPPPPPAAQSAGSIADAFVAAHNAVRAKHCAGPLTWSTKLAAYAQKWADTLRAKGCAFDHSHGPYGENLAAGSEGVLDPAGTVDYWYSEIKQYRFPDGGFSMNTGHFTQLVWRGTKSVGCGHATCNGLDVWVCEYDPPGNWEGEYRTNVLAPGCR